MFTTHSDMLHVCMSWNVHVGIVKTHNLGFQECEALQAVFTKDLCPNQIIGPAKWVTVHHTCTCTRARAHACTPRIHARTPHMHMHTCTQACMRTHTHTHTCPVLLINCHQTVTFACLPEVATCPNGPTSPKGGHGLMLWYQLCGAHQCTANPSLLRNYL